MDTEITNFKKALENLDIQNAIIFGLEKQSGAILHCANHNLPEFKSLLIKSIGNSKIARLQLYQTVEFLSSVMDAIEDEQNPTPIKKSSLENEIETMFTAEPGYHERN